MLGCCLASTRARKKFASESPPKREATSVVSRQKGREASAPGTRSRRPIAYAFRCRTSERSSGPRLNFPRSSIGPTRERMRNKTPTTRPVTTTKGGDVERGSASAGASLLPAVRKLCPFASAPPGGSLSLIVSRGAPYMPNRHAARLARPAMCIAVSSGLSAATGNAGLSSSTTSALTEVAQTAMRGSTKHSLVLMRFHFPFQRLCWCMPYYPHAATASDR